MRRLRFALAWLVLAALIVVGAWCVNELYKAEMTLRADRAEAQKHVIH
jgi:hypothetical protein